METSIDTAPMPAPAPQAQVQPYQPPPPPAPAPVADSGSSDVFTDMSSNGKKLDYKSILVMGLLIAVSIYGIVYYRKGIQRWEDDKKKNEDFLNLVDDVEEVKFNVKKALGKGYKATA